MLYQNIKVIDVLCNHLLQNNRLKRQKQAPNRSLAGSAIAPDMAEKRLQALQKIRELNALRKSQRGDLNMY